MGYKTPALQKHLLLPIHDFIDSNQWGIAKYFSDVVVNLHKFLLKSN